MRGLRSWRVVLLVLLVLVVLLALWLLPIRESLGQLAAWLQDLGGWGPILLALIYILVCILGLPGTPFTLVGAYALGLFPAAIAVSIGSTLGATAACWLGRTLARGWVEQWCASNPHYAALDTAVAAHGFRIILLTRLSPIFPFNLLNYTFGLTRVRLRDYLLASWLGMMPGTLLNCYLGSAARNISDLASGHLEATTTEQVLFYLGLTATVVVTVVVTRIAARALRATVPELAEAETTSATR